MKIEIKRAIEHMCETNHVRKVFWHMDEKVSELRYGIKQGDDAIVVGKDVLNMEGPYPLKTGRKTGLIHTCSDLVVMGAKPLYALNSMQVNDINEAKEVAEDLKKQSDGLGVPILGGNTQLGDNLTPCISFVVFGRLVNEPIPDSGAKTNDRILMLGEVVEGSIGERVYRAKTKFNTFLELMEDIDIHAAKDCSRGGWFGNLSEMLVKAKKGVRITSIPYPRITRYMGNYLIAVSDVEEVLKVAAKHKCPVVEVGRVTDDLNMRMGDEIVVEEKQMMDLIKKLPYRCAKS